MTREELDALWRDAANWRWGCIYVCRADPRLIIPKRIPWTGYTFNFAHRGSWWALLATFVGFTLPVAVLLIWQNAAALWTMVGLYAVLIAALLVICHWETNRPRL
jgi:uncharacterized membrane protein